MNKTTPSRNTFRTVRKLPARRVAPVLLVVTVLTLLAIGSSQHFGVVRAQAPAPPPHVVAGLASLKTVPVPEPRNLPAYIKDRTAAIALGKALFWDMAVGSDGQACASCHFHAGADSRSKNQLNPGFRSVPPDTTFTVFPPDGGGPNYQLQTSDFPFHKLADPGNQNSPVLFDTNDIASSAGVFFTLFVGVSPAGSLSDNDQGTFVSDPVFNVGGINVRGVEPRNTPTMINAVFNHRNFWDGRARFEFNGRNPIGKLDPTAKVLRVPVPGAAPEQISLIDGSHPDLELDNASLASQAVGPPLSNLEMSFDGRNFSILGRKMVPRRALARQVVAFDDSVLGFPMSRFPMTGLNTTYRDMIAAAIQNQWWDSAFIVQVNPDNSVTILPPYLASAAALNDTSAAANQFQLIEYNFPLIWGLAVQMYEATLVANDSRVDQFLDGQSGALSAQEQLGKMIFEGKGRCINCHGGAETTNASVNNVVNAQELLERMVMGDGGIAVYDNGFYNTAVRPNATINRNGEDQGLGATIGPFNLPLSNSRLFQQCVQEQLKAVPAPTVAQANAACNVPSIAVRPNESPLLATPQPLQPNERVAVDGAFKTPGLRNVELTAPYFHNGGQLTLEQVVDFYNRGGDFARANQDNLDPDIQVLNLTADEKAALVAFMKAFTDERVRSEKAPFDHPELVVSKGHMVDNHVVLNDGTGKGLQDTKHILPVGKGGRTLPDNNFPN
jgi:cytochrome c peroxidase